MGAMIGIDNREGIIKLAPSGEVHIMPTSIIGKLNRAPVS
jgi:hypothetical protein